jgi:hypothetical protein
VPNNQAINCFSAKKQGFETPNFKKAGQNDFKTGAFQIYHL